MIQHVKPSYTFKEIYELQKLPLDDKVKVSCEVLRKAFELHDHAHRMAVAFSGGKDSQVVSDLSSSYAVGTLG